jgi:hypothetical protein
LARLLADALSGVCVGRSNGTRHLRALRSDERVRGLKRSDRLAALSRSGCALELRLVSQRGALDDQCALVGLAALKCELKPALCCAVAIMRHELVAQAPALRTCCIARGHHAPDVLHEPGKRMICTSPIRLGLAQGLSYGS